MTVRREPAVVNATWARHAFRAAMAVVLGVGLSGCASMPFWGKKAQANEPPVVMFPMYELDINAPANLRELLSKYLDLARFQKSPEADGVSSGELNRLIAAAPAQARALLETEGYFNAEVKAQRIGAVKNVVGVAGVVGVVGVAGVAVSTTPSDAGTDSAVTTAATNAATTAATNAAATTSLTTLPKVVVTVTPGPPTKVASLSLDVQGPLREALQTADPAAITTWAALHRDWLLRPERDFRQSSWNSAKAAMLDRLRADGYPAAYWDSTEARIDAQANEAALDVTAQSGVLYRLSGLRIEGLQRHGESSVRNVANFAPGTPYSERLLFDFSERLRKLDLFESAVVDIEPEPADPAASLVQVRVRELPLQQATVGIGYSDNTGQRISLEHTHRRVFGLPWVAKNKIEWGQSRKLWDSELISHPRPGGYRYLLAFSTGREEAIGTVVQASRLRAGRTRDTEKLDRLVFAEALTARTSNAAGDNSNRAISGNVHWVRRDVDSVLLPTEGYTLNLQAALGQAVSNNQDDGPFGRAYARYTLYRPVGKTWFASARVEAAQLFANPRVGIPDTLLFRAGGDDSVRGYAYRSLGPAKDGLVGSGRVLLTGSVELATPISVKYPSIWWATFVDAGQAAERWGDWRPAIGVGVGLRWRSPVGPLKIDLAYGEAVKKLRLHLSVGIAF